MAFSTPQLLELGDRRIGKIDRVEEFLVRLPFVTPLTVSSATWSVKEAILIRVDAGGISGWGECVADPDPFYSPETTASAHYIIKEFLLPLLTPDVTLAELVEKFGHVRGNGMAKATVENALLDLIAKREAAPLHELLGYPRRPIPSGISIGIQDSVGTLLDKVAEAVDTGYHRVKMKIKRGVDIDIVRAVRERFPDILLMADANGDYTLADVARLRQLDAFGLTMIEQPLSYSDIYMHSLLQRELATPICLDESIHDLSDARAAVALGSCRIINIKEGRVGGLIESVRMADYCVQHGVPVWSGGMDETGIGRAFNIHLQTHPGFTIPGDTSETKRYFIEDIINEPVTLRKDGFIDVPEGPGIGVTINEKALEKYTLRRETLTAP